MYLETHETGGVIADVAIAIEHWSSLHVKDLMTVYTKALQFTLIFVETGVNPVVGRAEVTILLNIYL